MKKIILILLSIIISSVCFSQNLKTPCGEERWQVKTLNDPDTGKIDFKNIIKTTIAEQVELTSPKVVPSLLRQPLECKVYSIDCLLLGFKKESDGDIHIVIGDGTRTMICEIPNPDCIEVAKTKYESVFSGLWGYFELNIGKPEAKYKKLTPPIPVTITGVGFFDFIHGQTGVAKNARELHPVLKLVKR